MGMTMGPTSWENNVQCLVETKMGITQQFNVRMESTMFVILKKSTNNLLFTDKEIDKLILVYSHD